MIGLDPLSGLLSSLGIAAPLVALLWFLLRQATEERKAITNRFLTALESTVATGVRATQENTLATRELAATIEANRKSSVDEHGRIVDAIGKLELRGHGR